MNTRETVLIQRNENYQPTGIWVFVNDLDVVREILRDYGAYGTEDDDIDAFIASLEEMSMCDEAREALNENGRDGYLGECPEAWKF